MKAVDIIAEFKDCYLFVEMKDFHEPDGHYAEKDNFEWLKNYLKYKYRDSFLYRYAENRVDKPIHYICLLSFETGLNVKMQKALQQELPMNARRWTRKFVESCQVVNLEKWNKEFPKWPVKKI